MICSISTGKSGPNWLERLRSSKGFPAGNDVDLEHFLNRNPSSDSVSISVKNELESSSESVPLNGKQVEDLKKPRTSSNDRRNRKKEDWFNIMSSVLAELFVMGDSSEFARIRRLGDTRSLRKQKNPKFCVFSASASVEDFSLNGAQKADGVPAMSPSSADNSVAGVKEIGVVLKLKKNGSSGSMEEEKFLADRYSRVDVTIIDTSAPVWKSEKLVFRKGNVWKVRDKNSKCRRISSFRRKRKASQFDEEVGGKKRKKKKKQKLSPPPTSTSKEVQIPEERVHAVIEDFPMIDKRKSSKQTPENLNQVPTKRQVFSRSPRKPAKRDSFHIQGVPTSKKIWGSPSKKLL